MAKKTFSQEDADLFRQSIGKVKTIKNDKLVLNSNKKPKPYPQEQPEAINASFQETVIIEGIETLQQQDSMHFIAPGLQKNVLKKLRKGFFGLDDSIDLHGLSSKEAKLQLSRFLQNSIDAGYRCVHIIHGKGYRSSSQKPVLKNDVNLWLRQHNDVQAFCSASPKQGGTGAVLVLLKRSEKYSEEESG